MIKKMIKKVQGFTPLELLMVVGISAVVAGIFIFTASGPKPMAQLPPININVSTPDVNVAQAPSRAAPSTFAVAVPGVCGPNVVPNNGGFDVTATNTHPADITNVQCALDNVTPGATVLLKQGTFNFGPNEDVLGRQVFLKKSVTVTGEVTRDAQGKIIDWKTKIQGGNRSFFFLSKDADITVENLWFNENLFDAVHVNSCKTGTIQFCKITNTKVGIALATGKPQVYGILATEIPLPHLGVGLGSIGKVYAIENFIDIFNPDENNYTGDLNHSAGLIAVIILPPFGKEVHFIDNEIHNPGSASLSSIGAFAATVYASGNKIYQRDDYNFTYIGVTSSSQGMGNVGWTHPFTGAQFPAAKAVFTGNFIYNIPTVGMTIADTSNSIVKDNYIEMEDAVEGSSGIRVAKFDKAGTSNTLFEENTIVGTADYGIYVFDDANNNTFNIKQGEIETLNAAEANVYLGRDTHDNHFKFSNVNRSDVRITDRGKDNDIEFEPAQLTMAPSRYQGAMASSECIDGAGSNDVARVQAAVDGGGTVCLKGTFDFGAEGSVQINNSVEILGETDNRSNPLTKINGGHYAFYCDNPNATLKIKYLHFDGAKRSAIRIRRSAGAEITNNKIENLELEELWNEFPVGSPLRVRWAQAIGIYAGASWTEFFSASKLPCGDLTISDNDIDVGFYKNGELKDAGDYFDFVAQYQGVHITHCEGNMDISQNTVKNFNRIGIAFRDLYGVADITHNIIESAPFGEPGSFGGSSRNIGLLAISGHRDESSAEMAEYNIKHNKIIVNGPAGIEGEGMGPLFYGAVANSVISDNTVTLNTGSRLGIAVYTEQGTEASPVSDINPHHNLIRGNKIEGTVYGAAAAITALLGYNADNNVFMGNNLNGFSKVVSDATLIFSNNNVFVGDSGTVMEIASSGNMITGMEPMTGGVGEQISEVVSF